MKWQKMNRLFNWLLAVVFVFGCTSSEDEKTKIESGIYDHREIKIETQQIDGRYMQFASVVNGDSLVFVYSEYTHGKQESSGFNICFTVPRGIDSVHYSNNLENRLILKFGTGLSANLVDTIKLYDVIIINRNSKFVLKGNLEEIKISGEFSPIQ